MNASEVIHDKERWKLSADGRILTVEQDEPRHASNYEKMPIPKGMPYRAGEQGIWNDSTSRQIKWLYYCRTKWILPDVDGQAKLPR